MIKTPRIAVHVTHIDEIDPYLNAGATHLIIDNSYFSNRSMAPSHPPREVKGLLDHVKSIAPTITTSVTCDVILHHHMIPEIIDLFEHLKESPPTAIRYQDLGLLPLIHEHLPECTPTFISETGNSNNESLDVLEHLGAKSIQLNNEIPYSQLKNITQNPKINWQLQVHGHILIQHSHRKLLSSVSGKKDRHFTRSEDQDFKGRYYHFFESHHGCFMFGHFDRCLISEAKKLRRLALSDWIIDGRGLGIEHNVTVINAYQSILGEEEPSKEKLENTFSILQDQSRTPLKIGFFNTNKTDVDWRDQKTTQLSKYTIKGACIDIQKNSHIVVEVEEDFDANDTLIILTPENKELSFHKLKLSSLNNKSLKTTQNETLVKIAWIKGVTAGSKLVKKSN